MARACLQLPNDTYEPGEQSAILALKVPAVMDLQYWSSRWPVLQKAGIGIHVRIDELTRTRDALVESANRQVAAFNGGIEALRGLLEPEAGLPAETDKGEPTEPPAEKSQPAES